LGDNNGQKLDFGSNEAIIKKNPIKARKKLLWGLLFV